MKQNTLFIVICLLAILSCNKVEKDVNNYYPRVKTVGAVAQPDGTVKVTGEITYNGRGDISFLGFCLDTVKAPGMLSNQILVESFYEDNTFTAIYENLGDNKKYYVRAFAANDYGYTYGNDVEISDVSIEIPCQPQKNTAEFSGTFPDMQNYLSVEEVENLGPSEYRIRAHSNSHTYTFTFGQKPVTGKYQIFNGTPSENSLSIMIDGYTCKTGDYAYVTQIDANTVEVVVCNARINLDGMEVTFRTHLKSPY